MEPKKKIILFIIVILFGFLSVLIINGITYINNYEIGDLDGYIYEKIFSPLLGFLVVSISLYFFKKNIKEFRLLIFASIFSAFLLIFFVHFIFFFSGNVGGWYVQEKNDTLSNKSLSELLKESESRNTEISYNAWEEYLKRGEEDNSILLEYLKNKKENNPSSYIDDLKVRDVVEVLSKNKNFDVKPYLRDMLSSEKYIKLELPNNKIKYLYPTRKYAKNYLSKYFDETHADIVISEIKNKQ